MLAACSVAFAQTGDAYLDAAAAVVASPKPAPEVMAIVDAGGVDVNHYYNDGMTLMHYAAVSGRADVMKGFLERGGRLDIPRNQTDRATPLSLAKSPALVAYLTSIGAMKPASPGPVAGPTVNRPPKPAPAPAVSERRKICNDRHYSSSALCSDTTCKMREYRKWQTCLQTGSYY
jgi:ankyrin repeat protein